MDKCNDRYNVADIGTSVDTYVDRYKGQTQTIEHYPANKEL
jgi:hypothetical protein